ncbi:MAG: M48 family metalloprotease [Pirellulales bacterium]
MAGPAFWAILGLYGLGAVWPRWAGPSVDSGTALVFLIVWWGTLYLLPRLLASWGRRVLRIRDWVWLVTGLTWCAVCGMLPVHRSETTQLWDAVHGLLPLAVGWWIMETSLFGMAARVVDDSAQRSGTWREFRSWASSLWLAPSALLVVLLGISDVAIWLGGSPAVHFGAQLALALMVAGVANSLPAFRVRRLSRSAEAEVPECVVSETMELAEVAGICPPAVGLGWQQTSARLIAMWGLTARSSVVWLSPAVMHFSAEARRCLIAHELAHIRAGHPARRAALLVFLVGLTWLGIAELGWWGRYHQWSAGMTGVLTVCLTLAAATVGGLIFCGVARDFELQADHEACRLLARLQGTRRGGSGDVPDRELAEGYLAALAELTGSTLAGWLHPSWSIRRRQLLARLAADRLTAA